MNNTVLLMLSGGRDSFLAACRLLEDPKNYYLVMVTYDNGCSYQSGNARHTAERIIKRYGAERARYVGVHKIAGIIREFFFPYFNMRPIDQLNNFYGMTPSQFHCLICRTSMYIYSILLCKKYGISILAEGGRKSQKFVIELPGMAKERYAALTESQGIELLLPVYDLERDWERDNELLKRNYISKCFEAKCLIGVPIEDSIDSSVVDGVHAYYDKVILKHIKDRDLLNCQSFLKEDIVYDELQP